MQGSKALGDIRAARQLWMAKDKDIALLKTELNQAKSQLASAQEAFQSVQRSLSADIGHPAHDAGNPHRKP